MIGGVFNLVEWRLLLLRELFPADLHLFQWSGCSALLCSQPLVLPLRISLLPCLDSDACWGTAEGLGSAGVSSLYHQEPHSF